MTSVFLHGLESSSKGTKGSWFRERFPEILIPDFVGTLADRMAVLQTVLADRDNLVLVGSSFGGLMATVYVLEHPEKVEKAILLAPALNFPDFSKYAGRKTTVRTQLFIGRQDDVCPPEIVIPKAMDTFINLEVHRSDDDHPLRNTFPDLDWKRLLSV